MKKKQDNYLGKLSIILTVIFAILKVTNAITWSWWWVCSPVLIATGLTLLLLILAGIVVVYAKLKG